MAEVKHCIELENLSKVRNFCVPFAKIVSDKNVFLDEIFPETITYCNDTQSQVRMVSNYLTRLEVKKCVGLFSYKSNSTFKYVHSKNEKNDCMLNQMYRCKGHCDAPEDKENESFRYVSPRGYLDYFCFK